MGEPAFVDWLTEGDRYYFSHHDGVSLPVLRVIWDDPRQTRYYLDPTSGKILRKVDSAARRYRWLHNGLHRLDFFPLVRSRPLWDVLMLGLLAGCIAATATGFWAGIRRVTAQARSRNTLG